MFQELKLVFQSHAHVKRYETFDEHFPYKMEDNSSASEHVLRMSEYYNHLNQVGVNLPDEMVMVLQKTLPPSCESFVMNYNILRIDTMILERFVMFDTAKVEIKKERQ